MFAIRYQNELLDLVPGQNPVIEWVSTAFNDSDTFLGSYSYPIDLAPTPKNNRLLGFGNQLAMRTSRRDITVLIELFDMPWKACTMSYDIEDGLYKSNLKIDNGEFANKIKEIKIAQVFVDSVAGVFSDHKWELVGSDTAATEAAILNAVTGPGAAPWTMYPYKNTNIFGTYNGDGAQQYSEPLYINCWIPRVGTILESDLKQTWYSFSFYLDWVLKKLCTYLGYTATGDVFEDPFFQSLVIDNNTIYGMQDVFHPNGFMLAPARHLPDITIGDLFKRIRNYKKLILYFDSDTKKAHFVFSDRVISSPDRISLDKYVEKGFRTQRLLVSGFEITQGIDEKDEMFKLMPYVKNYFIGAGEEKQKIDLLVSTCFMGTLSNTWRDPLGTIRIPVKEQVGNAYSDRAIGSEAHNPEGYGRNAFSLKLLSYRGMHPDTVGNLYPYATSDGLGTDGLTEICQSLWLGGANGILEKIRSWYTFLLRTEPVEISAKLPNIILNRLSPIKKIRFPTEEGIHLEALMDKAQFSTDKNKLLINTRMTVYPIYSGNDIIAFNPGEVANPNVVFVKIIEENLRTRYRSHFLGGKVKESEVVDVVLYFYSDLAGTIPIVVNALPVTVVVHYKGIHPENYLDTPSTITAYGERFVWVQNAIRWYSWNDEFKTYSWTVSEGNGYRAIF